MIRIDAGATPKYCDGHSRRSFLQIGVAGMASAGLPKILKAREAAVQNGASKKETSVILI